MSTKLGKQNPKRSDNARAVAREVVATLKAGKKVRKSTIIKKHGYTDSVAAHPKSVTETKSYKEEIDPFIQAMITERDAVIKEMKKKRSGASYRDMTDSLDKLTKNIELLSGRDTARVGGLVDEVYNKL